VALFRLNDKAGAAEVIRAWQDRSAPIGALLTRKQSRRDLSTAAVAADEPAAAPSVDRTADNSTGGIAAAAGDDARGDGAGYAAAAAPRAYATDGVAASRRGAVCQASIPVLSLSPERALAGGWCRLDRNRPVEAAAAFAVASLRFMRRRFSN